MLIKLFKVLFIFVLYQGPLYSKSNILNDFNSRNLSNYFSGIVAYKNKNNPKALKFFRSSKFLIKHHDSYLERYVNSLVLEGKVQEATNQIKQNFTDSNSNFFKGHLLLSLESIKKKNYKKSKEHLQKSYIFIGNDKISLIIFETLKQYLYVFEENKIPKKKNKFGSFSFVNQVFQACYLDDKSTQSYFENLVSNKENARNLNSDYSRYIFFYLSYLTGHNKHDKAKELVDNLNYINASLLIAQGKKWIEEQEFKKFQKIFSCRNSNDIIGELFFLVANLYSSQDDLEQSNFYLNISNYLNAKFIFNLSLLAENYFLNENYSKAKKILRNFKKEDNFYYWFKLKKEAKIILKEKNEKASLDFINSKFEKIKKPSIKAIFDIANFNKNMKKYERSIEYYDQVLLKTDINSDIYHEILYRRGTSYERLGDYENSDKDLLKSLQFDNDNAFVLNYLAYSWLEREYKVDTALQMLKKAYQIESNDPYIIDSIGWAYYLIDDYSKAEKFLKRAVELMPRDPIVNDHYGDILWKLDRKIQARYFWKSVLSLEETEDKMKNVIQNKLIEGLKKS